MKSKTDILNQVVIIGVKLDSALTHKKISKKLHYDIHTNLRNIQNNLIRKKNENKK